MAAFPPPAAAPQRGHWACSLRLRCCRERGWVGCDWGELQGTPGVEQETEQTAPVSTCVGDGWN